MNYPAASGRGIFKSNERPKGGVLNPSYAINMNKVTNIFVVNEIVV